MLPSGDGLSLEGGPYRDPLVLLALDIYILVSRLQRSIRCDLSARSTITTLSIRAHYILTIISLIPLLSL